MRYLQQEKELFEHLKRQFCFIYSDQLRQMEAVFVDRGADRDGMTPIHHRQSPEGMLALAQAKCRRIERALATDNYDVIIEECTDVANYALFIATLATMIKEECDEDS